MAFFRSLKSFAAEFAVGTGQQIEGQFTERKAEEPDLYLKGVGHATSHARHAA